jgi:hypothetical protein
VAKIDLMASYRQIKGGTGKEARNKKGCAKTKRHSRPEGFDGRQRQMRHGGGLMKMGRDETSRGSEEQRKSRERAEEGEGVTAPDVAAKTEA